MTQPPNDDFIILFWCDRETVANLNKGIVGGLLLGYFYPINRMLSISVPHTNYVNKKTKLKIK